MHVVVLDTDKLWRGVLYPAGPAEIPDDLAQAMGLLVPDEGPGFADPLEPGILEAEILGVEEAIAGLEDLPFAFPAEGPPPALVLINSANTPEEITPIKGVGIGGARRLLANRPAEGYASLDAAAELNPELAKSPYHVRWEQVAAWEEG